MALRRSSRLVPLLLLLLVVGLVPTTAQDSFQDIIEMSIEAGFNSFFRPDEWTPIRIQVKNNGESLVGRIVIRPETSGTVVGNAFSTPIDLPRGAEKSALINIKARTFPDSVRVELIDDNGFIHMAQDAPLIDLRQQDQLYAVVTGANTAPISLAGVHIGGFEAEQAIWNVSNIPDNSLAMQSLDVILLSNIDSEALSSAQRTAIESWVVGGGHLIVTGGPNAQGTAQAFADILPFTPDANQSIDNLSALAEFSSDLRSALVERTVIATGTVNESGRVLVVADDIPVLIRRDLGIGIIDYLVADPTLEPLASWNNITALWMTLLSSRDPQPVWTQGFTRPEWGADAIASLPGVDLLPPIQTLCLFLAAYIILIGPINYFVLSRINRNGWGWLTIPVIIVLFTSVAWTVGFNLRGSEIIVSRASVVQTWVDTDIAKMNQFVGLLSPRRATYSVAVPEGHYLGVTNAANPTGLFASNTVQTATEIRQGTAFSADEFTIDGGIFANFAIAGDIERPNINGTVSLSFDITESGRLAGGLQGLVRNESDITLRDVGVVGHNIAYHLGEDFAPGDLVTLNREDLRMDISDDPPQPNLLEYHVSQFLTSQSPFSRAEVGSSIGEIQGERYLRSRAFLEAQSIAEKQSAREQAFLASFVTDQFNSSARGTKAYLIGWHDEWNRDLDIEGAAWNSVDTTLYIIELDVSLELPTETVTLTSEYFSWMTLDRVGLSEVGTDDFNVSQGQQAEYRLTPLAGLEMDEVDTLLVEVDRGGGYAQSLTVEVYNWESDEYELFTFRDGDELEFEDAESYLGQNNIVQVRIFSEQAVGASRVRKIRVAQTGRYT